MWLHHTCLMMVIKRSLNPLLLIIEKRYVCEILSKASLKSRDRMHRGSYVTSAFEIASLTVATASSIVLPVTPQYWLGCNSSDKSGLRRSATILAKIL